MDLHEPEESVFDPILPPHAASIRPFAHTCSRLCRAAVLLCSRRNRAEGCFIKKEQDRPDLKLHVCRRIKENFDPEKISALRATSHGSTGMSRHIIVLNPAYWADSSLFVRVSC